MKETRTNPPPLFLKFFRWYCHPKLLKYIEGDLMELYEERREKNGKLKADIRFIIDVVLLFRPGIIRPAEGTQNLNTYGMYKSYFKIGWRSLVKNKGYSYINIIGLSVGMTVTLLIGMWVFDETTQNTNHRNYDQIARVQQHLVVNNAIQTSLSVPMPLAVELKNSFKNDFKNVVSMWWESSHILSIEDKKIPRNGVFMDKEGLEMFSFEMLKGSSNSLHDPSSIVLSESTAKALFGDNDPINQLLKIDNSLDVKVTGVFKEMPFSSLLHSLEFISSWDLWLNSNIWMKENENNWNSNVLTFVEIQPGTTFEQISAKIKNIKFDRLPSEQAEKENPQLFLQPMSRWHLYSEWRNGQETGGRVQFVWLFGIIGGFVLVLACINFMNLSTAQSEMRAKEVGIRKSVGSARTQLIYQFFIETFLIVVLASLLAVGIASLALPWFNELAEKEMTMPWTNTTFLLTALGFILFTSILAGSYPALFLSSFQPVKVLKGTFKVGRFANTPRKALVVLQFSVSVALIIGTITVWRQIQFAKNRPVGYTREGLIMVRKNSPDFWGMTDVLRNKLKEADAIMELAESASPATETWFNSSNFDWPGKDPNAKIDFACVPMTHDYGKTMGWNFVQGRDYSRDYSTDSSAIILNETAAKMIGWENPVNEEITLNGKKRKVIGVIKDMIVDSPYDPVKQSIYFLNYNGNVWINIRLNPNLGTHEAIARVESVFQSVLPAVPFEFKFTDQEYEKKFASEERIGKLASLFAILAIFISCLGLFGLASFVARQRTKEISIRKVMGASVMNLWSLLSKDFVLTVAISIVISIPFAWYVLNNWLGNFQYRTELSWWIFGVAGLGAIMITLFTVSYQSIRAALVNPVKSLRSE